MKDLLGRTIKAGDYVVKPGRASSSIWLSVYYVNEVLDSGLLNVLKVATNGWGDVNKKPTKINSNDTLIINDGTKEELSKCHNELKY